MLAAPISRIRGSDSTFVSIESHGSMANRCERLETTYRWANHTRGAESFYSRLLSDQQLLAYSPVLTPPSGPSDPQVIFDIDRSTDVRRADRSTNRYRTEYCKISQPSEPSRLVLSLCLCDPKVSEYKKCLQSNSVMPIPHQIPHIGGPSGLVYP